MVRKQVTAGPESDLPVAYTMVSLMAG